MNISISAPIFDIEGHVYLSGISPEGLQSFERRNNRVKTLDGGAVIPDFGYSDSDRTFEIRISTQKREAIDVVIRLAKTYSRLIISTGEGCFVGAPGPFSISSGEAVFQILIEKRIDL